MRSDKKRLHDICLGASRDLKNSPGVLAVSSDGEKLIITVAPGTAGRPILEIVAKYKVVIRFEETSSLVKAGY